MLIRRLELQNIKSYDHAEITFSPGVNLIAGENGAGKTTLIEALGLALFGYSPEKRLKDYFIREGEKKGSITVDFTDNGGEDYRVVRKLSASSSSWHAYDLEDRELDLHTATDLEAWMRERIGAEPGVNLAKLFSDIIGVNQGAFTAPFLIAPAERKRLFNAILGVDSYEEASRKGKDTTSLLLSRITQVQLELKEYEAAAVQAEGLRHKKMVLEEEIGSLGTQHQQFSSLLTSQTNEKNALLAHKQTLEQISRQLQSNEAQGESLRQELALLRRQLAGASKAQNTLAQSLHGYTRYLALQQEQQTLDARRDAQSSLQLRLSALQNDFAAEKSALKANQAALDKDLAREQAISTQKQKEIDSLYPLLAQSDQDIQRQTAVLDSLQRERVLLDATSAQIAAQEALLSRLQTGYDNLLALEQTIQQQQERLTSKAALQAQADGLPALEKTVEQHKNRLSAFRQQVQTLRQDAEKSRDGQCPILNTPCPNVSGNLSDFLLQKAHAIQQESDREAEQMLGPQASLEKARAAREALVSLAPVEEALEQNRSQREKYFHAFAHYTRQWAQESASVMPDLPQATDAAQWQQALVLLSRQQEADQSAYHTKTTALEQTKTACISSLSQLEEQKMSRQEKINAAQADKSVADLAILSIKQALGSQEQKRLQLAQQKQAIASLQSQLQSYDDLEQAILHTREQMQALLSQYEAYIQHRAEAQRLPEIQGEIAAREAREKERLTQRALLIQQQKSIASFDEAAYEALSARVESTIAQLAQTKGALDVKQKDHSALLEEIHALEARLKKAEELEQQHDLLQRTTQLSRLLFDTILRNAGERVAALYRSRITQDAAQLYREVSMENVALQWSADYDILLSDVVHGQERFRSFRQLSGGEQMTAALSVRLGLLNRFSSAGIAFFDEPTSNLDARRRENLAMVIPAVTSRFQQVFVISHDDAFDSITDSILRLTKAPGGTVVEK